MYTRNTYNARNTKYSAEKQIGSLSTTITQEKLRTKMYKSYTHTHKIHL